MLSSNSVPHLAMSAKESVAKWATTRPTTNTQLQHHKFTKRYGSVALALGFAILATLLLSFFDLLGASLVFTPTKIERNLYTPVFNYSKQTILSRCARIMTIPGPPASFLSRDESERYEKGTNATLIRNAVIFTGEDDGKEVIQGDILLDKGIIRGLGRISPRIIDAIENLQELDAKGAWITPGLGGFIRLPLFPRALSISS